MLMGMKHLIVVLSFLLLADNEDDGHCTYFLFYKVLCWHIFSIELSLPFMCSFLRYVYSRCQFFVKYQVYLSCYKYLYGVCGSSFHLYLWYFLMTTDFLFNVVKFILFCYDFLLIKSYIKNSSLILGHIYNFCCKLKFSFYM